MRTLIRHVAIVPSIVVFLAGCATEVRPTARAMPKSVPDLSVVIDCGGCEVRPAVPDLIRTAYADAAVKAGVAVAGDAPIIVTIKEYTTRSKAIRVASMLAGPLAFALKDEIKVVVVVDGTPVPLEYSYHAPFKGIDAVATKLGEMSFDAVTRQRPKD
ncbi:MAG TPA: hypothetical protein VF471_10825 [Pseudoxanthomonas sp.]